VSEKRPFACHTPHGVLVVADLADMVEVTLRGEFDLSSNDAAQLMLQHVGELIGASPRPIVVEMSDVTFFDAVGIRLLLRLERLASLASTTSTVKNTTPTIRLLLEIVELERLLA
jgi:anti-anti-sigma factor